MPLIDLPDVDVRPLAAGGSADGHASPGPEAADGFRPGGGTHRIDRDVCAGSGNLPDLRAELRMSQTVDRHRTEFRSFRRLAGTADEREYTRAGQPADLQRRRADAA